MPAARQVQVLDYLKRELGAFNAAQDVLVRAKARSLENDAAGRVDKLLLALGFFCHSAEVSVGDGRAKRIGKPRKAR